MKFILFLSIFCMLQLFLSKNLFLMICHWKWGLWLIYFFKKKVKQKKRQNKNQTKFDFRSVVSFALWWNEVGSDHFTFLENLELDLKIFELNLKSNNLRRFLMTFRGKEVNTLQNFHRYFFIFICLIELQIQKYMFCFYLNNFSSKKKSQVY